MEHDGFSLDDKRLKVSESDIPDILDCWENRRDPKFNQKRTQRMAELQKRLAPLKTDRLKHQEIIHGLKFDEVIASDYGAALKALEKAELELANLQSRIDPLQEEFNQLSRQFWATKAQMKAHKYDLSAACYRQVEHDEVFYEQPDITLNRLSTLERTVTTAIGELQRALAAK